MRKGAHIVRRLGAVAAGWALCTAASPARAADDTDAEALVRQGVELRRQGHNDLALPLFERAYRMAPSGRTSAQLGLVRLAVDEWILAEGLLAESLKEGGAWVDKNRPVLDGALATARTHIGTLLVKGLPPGASVVLDGETVGKAPMASPVEVAEGHRRLLVRAAGFTDFAEELVVVGQQAQVVEVDLREPAAGSAAGSPPAPAVAPAPEEAHAGRSPWPWVTAGGAAAALVLGVVEHVRWSHGVSDFDAVTFPVAGGQPKMACAENAPMRGLSTSCSGIYDRYTTARTLTFVGYGAGAALAVTSAILFVRGAHTTARGSGEVAHACGPDIVHNGWQCVFRF